MSEALSLPDTVVLPIEQIVPYWRNPRRIPDDAVDAVAISIERYGYVQPVVVDTSNVVIVGHTRLRALKKLGWTEVPVYVANLPEAKAREYRLIDNRTGEMSSWDHGALVLELREFEQSLLESFFPEIDLEIGLISEAVTAQDVSDAEVAVAHVQPVSAIGTLTTKVTCPSCYDVFEVRTRSLPGLSTADLYEMADAADGEDTSG